MASFDPQREAGWVSSTKPEQQYLAAKIRCGDLHGARTFAGILTAEIRQKITEDSSLMLVALRENKPEFIRFLVEECNAQFEQLIETCVWDNDVCDDSITPLRYAARFKKTEAAVELVRLGANVNAVSPNARRTALHDACQSGSLVIARHLIQQGADLTKRAYHGKTALMYAIDQVDVCRELIARGADVNAIDDAGDTALHYAVDDGHKNPDMVKLLLENGADLFKKNDKGYDVHYLTCRDQAIDIVKVMRDWFSGDEIGQTAMIRSHQLLGACYINYHNPIGAYSHVVEALVEWEAAIRLREKWRHAITGEDDVVSTPNSSYDNAVEVDSMVKFDEMRQDINKIFMQGLLLKEKILGPTHRNTIESVMHLAEFYFKSEDYGRGLRLLRHGIRLSRDHRVSSIMSYHYVSQLWNNSVRHIELQMLVIKNTLNFSDIYEFLEAVTDESTRLEVSTIEHSNLTTVSDIFIQITVTMITLFSWLKVNELNTFQFRMLLHEFVRLNVKTSQGRTILMKAICPQDYDWFYPGFNGIKLLLECGADIGETDNNGNSVLHLLAKSQWWFLWAKLDVPTKEENRKLAELLLAFGAHFDARNNQGFTAVDYLSSLGLEFSAHMTLQCLAAQAILRHKVPYVGILPKSLVEFVQMH